MFLCYGWYILADERERVLLLKGVSVEGCHYFSNLISVLIVLLSRTAFLDLERSKRPMLHGHVPH